MTTEAAERYLRTCQFCGTLDCTECLAREMFRVEKWEEEQCRERMMRPINIVEEIDMIFGGHKKAVSR